MEEGENKEFQSRILHYNYSPVSALNRSPNGLFFGRLMTAMPVSESVLVRCTINDHEVSKAIEGKIKKQKEYYDRGAKSMSMLRVEDDVMFRKNMVTWKFGSVPAFINNRYYLYNKSYLKYVL